MHGISSGTVVFFLAETIEMGKNSKKKGEKAVAKEIDGIVFKGIYYVDMTKPGNEMPPEGLSPDWVMKHATPYQTKEGQVPPWNKGKKPAAAWSNKLTTGVDDKGKEISTDYDRMPADERLCEGSYLVAKMPDVGLAVFILEDIEKDTLITYYAGEVMTREELAEHGLRDSTTHVACDKDTLRGKVICAARKGNLGSLINHAFNEESMRNLHKLPPEAGYLTANIRTGGVEPHLSIYAASDIKAFTQLVWDYGPQYWLDMRTWPLLFTPEGNLFSQPCTLRLKCFEITWYPDTPPEKQSAAKGQTIALALDYERALEPWLKSDEHELFHKTKLGNLAIAEHQVFNAIEFCWVAEEGGKRSFHTAVIRLDHFKELLRKNPEAWYYEFSVPHISSPTNKLEESTFKATLEKTAFSRLKVVEDKHFSFSNVTARQVGCDGNHEGGAAARQSPGLFSAPSRCVAGAADAADVVPPKSGGGGGAAGADAAGADAAGADADVVAPPESDGGGGGQYRLAL